MVIRSKKQFKTQRKLSNFGLSRHADRVKIVIHVKKLKFVVEKHRDGYVAYPLGLKGAVVGQGDSSESALADARSAAAFHIESFGKEAFDDQDDVMEAFVTEASLSAG